MNWFFYPANTCPSVSANLSSSEQSYKCFPALGDGSVIFSACDPISLPTVPCTEAHSTYKFKVFPPTLGAA